MIVIEKKPDVRYGDHIRVMYPNGSRVTWRVEQGDDVATVMTDIERVKEELRMLVREYPELLEFVTEDDADCAGLMLVRVKQHAEMWLVMMMEPDPVAGTMHVGFYVDA